MDRCLRMPVFLFVKKDKEKLNEKYLQKAK